MKKRIMPLLRIFLLLGIAILFSNEGFTQQENVDSIFYQKAVRATIASYKNDLKENICLYNAAQYSFVSKQSYGFPFWNADSLIIGSIYYDDNCYNNVPLKYDLVNQKIVTTAFESNNQVSLSNEKIQKFKINTHQFFWIDGQKSNLKNISTGFYDQLYIGKIVIWAKRSKELKFSLNADDQTGNFKIFDRYYIQTGNTFNEVTDKKEAIQVLKNKRKELEELLKTEKNDAFDVFLVKMAGDYDQLSN